MPGTGTYTIYHFHVDFATPANTTFTLVASPPPPASPALHDDPRLRARAGNGDRLDAIGDRLMFRARLPQVRRGHEAVVGN